MAKAPVGELELALARALFKCEKWDPVRDKDEPFDWQTHKRRFVVDAQRLLRTFEKDGLELTQVEAAQLVA